ncbi:MAG: hypothetical protein ABW148_17025 [Sedimenticola sp.]
MSVNTDDLIEFAKSHIDTKDETCLRAALSRAYYAMHHRAKDSVHHCSDIQFKKGDGGSHLYLIKRFNTVNKKFHGQAKAREISSLLSKAKRIREEADYELNLTIPTFKLKMLIGFAEKLHKEAAALDSMHESVSGSDTT